jgi:amino-acid N-acetyltransferase
VGQTGRVVDPVAVPAAERAFYVAEFAGATIVVALRESELAEGEVDRVATALAEGASRLVLVAGGEPGADGPPGSSPGPGPDVWVTDDDLDPSGLAGLWLAVADAPRVTVRTPEVRRSVVAAHLAASLRALKLVITDDQGGWGRPARSFADVRTHRDAYRSQLADRQGGQVVEAVEVALAGGVSSVNLCRADELDRELFTFDGTGTLFTSGGYVALAPLRIDDLAAVEDLVAQGTADGVLRPRSRLEVARLAATGLGAKVVGSGHLAGVVGLETEPYRAEGVGEVAGLYTVSRFSGSGAGGLLVEGLLERAAALGLRAVFAVTVSQPAAELFTRKGFREVAPGSLPEAKWLGYDPERLRSARAFWADLDAPHV